MIHHPRALGANAMVDLELQQGADGRTTVVGNAVLLSGN